MVGRVYWLFALDITVADGEVTDPPVTDVTVAPEEGVAVGAPIENIGDIGTTVPISKV
jgi:hypothetical protein